MGDVALLTPVLKAMNEQYPGTEVFLLTRPAFTPLFSSIEGLRIITPDFRGRHSGFPGLLRLYRDIWKSAGRIDAVIDLHDVLRTRILRFFFRFRRIKVSVIDKDRKGKQEVISGKRKETLRHTVERYADAFSSAGFVLNPYKGYPVIPDHGALKRAEELTGGSGKLNIGIAPYAKHKLKIWPEEYMKALLSLISDKYPIKFWFFGGREEKDRLSMLAASFPGSENTAGLFSLMDELALISSLDLMIAMDSANMHLAALTGTPVISIWGATDPLTGFGAWQQPDERSIRIPAEELTCRPCTIYGKGKCRRGDFACMTWLTPEMVFEKLLKMKII